MCLAPPEELIFVLGSVSTRDKIKANVETSFSSKKSLLSLFDEKPRVYVRMWGTKRKIKNSENTVLQFQSPTFCDYILTCYSP